MLGPHDFPSKWEVTGCRCVWFLIGLSILPITALLYWVWWLCGLESHCGLSNPTLPVAGCGDNRGHTDSIPCCCSHNCANEDAGTKMGWPGAHHPHQVAGFLCDMVSPLVTHTRPATWPFHSLCDNNKLLVSCNTSPVLMPCSYGRLNQTSVWMKITLTSAKEIMFLSVC